MSDSKRDSVPQNKRSFTIAASPLNPVKFELGIILFIGFFLLISVQGLTKSPVAQVGILAGYGIISMLLLIYRTKRLLVRSEKVVQSEKIVQSEKSNE